MLGLPFGIFWFILFFTGSELGFRGVVTTIVVWAALLGGFLLTGWPPQFFVAVQALIDVVLLLIAFGGDIRIR